MTRYLIRCRICKQSWAEEVVSAQRVGRFHACTAGDTWGIRSMRLDIHRVGWKPGREHSCTVSCWTAKGPSCRCECKGERHASLRVRKPPEEEKSELAEHYRRLEGGAA